MQQPKAIVLQTDNRTDCDYLGLSRLVNSKWVEYLNKMPEITGIEYEYVYKHMEPHYYKDMHPATGKINVVRELLNTRTDATFLIFLDSDAWIQEPGHLHHLLLRLLETPDIHGAYSRDPYLRKNTYINSGSFILKIDDFTRSMYEDIYDHLQKDKRFHNLYYNDEFYEFIYDQYYVSGKVYERREQFMIFQPEILNTPLGCILRHHWHKTHTMFKDMYRIMDIIRYNSYSIPEPMDYEKELDDQTFPNTQETGKEYWRI
jgi:hypothetical protein